MKLPVLALRNIKLNFRSYIMYIFSLVFSVFTCFTFLSLIYNDQVMEAFSNIQAYQYRSLLLSSGLMIAVFVAFFLVSSNNSFIKGRKKEISTYSLFGMTNRRIGQLLFIEMVIAGLPSLLAGIITGIFFSKLVSMALLSITLAPFTGDITFSVSLQAVFITIFLFTFIFIIMGLSGYRVINKFELAELFKGEKASEERWKGSYFLLVISLLLIGLGYFLSIIDSAFIVSDLSILVLLLVIQGTYFFFMGGLPKVLSMLKKFKNSYYKGDNLISGASISHQMQSIGALMATITLLTAVAVTAIATGYTFYTNVERTTYYTVGFDLAYLSDDEELHEEISEVLARNNSELTGSYSLQLYESTGTNNQEYIRIYSLEEYNNLNLLSQSGRKPASMQKGEALFVGDGSQHSEAMKGVELRTESGITVAEVTSQAYLSFSPYRNAVVLEDSDFEELLKNGQIVPSEEIVHVLNYTNALKSKETNTELERVLTSSDVISYQTAFNTYNEAMQTFGLFLFTGFFISTVVILMTASLLYFKQITAAVQEKHQFIMLRKIGMNKETEKKVITKRLLPVFLIPLLFGIVHSIVAMKGADTLFFQEMIPEGNTYLQVLGFSTVMYFIYALIYGIFYLITREQYARIVRQ